MTEPESTPGNRDLRLSASDTPVVSACGADNESPCALRGFPDPRANLEDLMEAFVLLAEIEDKPHGTKRPKSWLENHEPVNHFAAAFEPPRPDPSERSPPSLPTKTRL